MFPLQFQFCSEAKLLSKTVCDYALSISSFFRKFDQENLEDVILYRSRIVSINSDKNSSLQIDLFDYELKLELTKNLEEENYVCDALDGSHFKIFGFPKQLLKFECPVLR